MLLICGSSKWAVNPPHEIDGIVLYPTVLYCLDEEDPDLQSKLEAYKSTVVEPFVVRLLDKDFLKIALDGVGKKLLDEART